MISFEEINSGFWKNLLESSDIWWNPWKSVNAINNATMFYALGANPKYWRNWKKDKKKVAWLAVQNVPLNKIIKNTYSPAWFQSNEVLSLVQKLLICPVFLDQDHVNYFWTKLNFWGIELCFLDCYENSPHLGTW